MSIPGAASPLFLATTGAAAAFEISRSLRFNSADSAHLSRTPSSASNRKTWTWSGWVRRSILGTRQQLFSAPSGNTYIEWQNDKIQIEEYSGGLIYKLAVSAVQRDPSAWYHFVFQLDTTQATAADRVKIYINGVRQETFSSASYPSQNHNSGINGAVLHKIGAFPGTGDSGNFYYFNGYLAEVNFCDGTAYDASSFGEFDDNGVWQAKDTAGLTFGTNGFRLKFADNSGATATTLGKDTSANSNNWTPNNLSVAAGAGNDSLVDSPTNGTASSGGDPGGSIVGNYATLNPLNLHSDITLSNGNLELTKTNNAYRTAVSTIGVSSGKWYFEVKPTANVDGTMYIGIEQIVRIDKQISYQNGNNGFAWRAEGGFIQNDAMGSGSSYGSAGYTNNDVIGVAADLDNGSLTFYKNGTSQGAATIFNGGTLPSGTYFFGVSPYASGATVQVNFGQRAFAYTAPSGYKSLNTANLPEPTIADGSQYFDTKLYTSTGADLAVTGLQFSPDFVWVKNRQTANHHGLFDIVRGPNKFLQSNRSNAESTTSGSGYGTGTFNSFDANGFTVGSDVGANVTNYPSGQPHVAWAWDGGSSTVSNTDGSITSNVRAQPSAGFSVVTADSLTAYTEYSIGHSLNAVPQFIIGKNRAQGSQWDTYHVDVGAGQLLRLNGTASATSAGSNDSNFSTTPTSSVFYFKANGATNNYVFYCFAPVEGYSAMGSYEGNGNADGIFVHTGFKIAWLMIKNIDNYGSGYDWFIFDSKRDTYNTSDAILKANLSGSESDSDSVDILSNGFKLRATTNGINLNAHTHVYLAFASNPFASNGGLAR